MLGSSQLHRSHSDAERDDVNNAHHNRLPADRARNGAQVQRRDALSARVSEQPERHDGDAADDEVELVAVHQGGEESRSAKPGRCRDG
jgi:hypothetical protein